jgi:hypothetical protein
MSLTPRSKRYAFALVHPTFVFFMVLMGSTPPSVLAQDANDSHWGLSASFTPVWTSDDEFREKILNLEGEGTVEGTEFTIGFVRGSTGGGDWGVSYVRKPFKDGSGTIRIDESCFDTSCSTTTRRLVTQDVMVTGPEFHWFRPFGTIKGRVQIGINVGGGVGFVRGTIDQTTDFVNSFTLPNGQVVVTSNRDVFSGPATDVMYSIVPLIKAEAQGAIIVAPGFKIKIGGGLNFPSVATVRIGAVYLFGAN